MTDRLIYVGVTVFAVVFAGILGYWIGYSRKKAWTDVLLGIVTNLDNYVIVLSAIVIFLSIIFSIKSEDSKTAVIVLNMFSCVIFSWLLTRKSSKKDFKEKEEELALKSYRHINYIEMAANTASKAIEKHLDEAKELSLETKLVLSNAKSQITYIQGGINTCKMDWYDLLSPMEQENHNGEKLNSDEYGTYDAVMAEVNQEEA